LGDLVGHDVHLGGFDLDSCLVDGVVADWAQRILDLAETYSEISPSHPGIKLYFYISADDVRSFLDDFSFFRTEDISSAGQPPIRKFPTMANANLSSLSSRIPKATQMGSW